MVDQTMDSIEEQFSSQIIEEEDLFFDDPSFMESDDDESTALFEEAVAQHNKINDHHHDNNDSQNDTLRSRLAGPSAHKAGLDTIDKNEVNRIIYEASKGSAFFENERKRDEALTKRIDEMLKRYDKIKNLDLSFEKKVVDHKIKEMELSRDLTQCICHIDMDAFYASVEELDDPSLKEIPMAVGGMSMLCTSNYLARKKGVRSGMPGFIGLKLCPELKLIPLHFPKYRAASNKVRAIFAKYDPDFLPLSLDEAYLNLTKYLTTTNLSPSEVVQNIRDEIFAETQLTASAGIASNKMLAKICSDMNKPNGQYFLPMDRVSIMAFTKDLHLRKVSGIGRVTERVLESLDVITCGDVYNRRAMLYKLLSPISFKFMIKCYLGIGSTFLNNESERKSISVERTFSPISNKITLYNKVDELSKLLAEDLSKYNLKGKTVGIKLKLDTFAVRARAKTFPHYISDSKEIAKIAKKLLDNELPISIRLMGIRMSTLKPKANDDYGVKKYFNTITSDNEVNTLPSKRKNDDINDTVTEPIPSSSSTIPTYLCPICNRALQLDNKQMNDHIDDCLTKIEVKEILKEQNNSIPNNDYIDNNNSDHSNSNKKKKINDGNKTKSLFDYYKDKPT
ncbi:hypothetical protein BJ944DRAFT_267053 [Cunninghamella echinulata]|nr:hypothetical protein BJ944DRAFT_267053 [Cunninghamella echinulata]